MASLPHAQAGSSLEPLSELSLHMGQLSTGSGNGRTQRANMAGFGHSAPPPLPGQINSAPAPAVSSPVGNAFAQSDVYGFYRHQQDFGSMANAMLPGLDAPFSPVLSASNYPFHAQDLQSQFAYGDYDPHSASLGHGIGLNMAMPMSPVSASSRGRGGFSAARRGRDSGYNGQLAQSTRGTPVSQRPLRQSGTNTPFTPRQGRHVEAATWSPPNNVYQNRQRDVSIDRMYGRFAANAQPTTSHQSSPFINVNIDNTNFRTPPHNALFNQYTPLSYPAFMPDNNFGFGSFNPYAAPSPYSPMPRRREHAGRISNRSEQLEHFRFLREGKAWSVRVSAAWGGQSVHNILTSRTSLAT